MRYDQKWHLLLWSDSFILEANEGLLDKLSAGLQTNDMVADALRSVYTTWLQRILNPDEKNLWASSHVMNGFQQNLWWTVQKSKKTYSSSLPKIALIEIFIITRHGNVCRRNQNLILHCCCLILGPPFASISSSIFGKKLIWNVFLATWALIILLSIAYLLIYWNGYKGIYDIEIPTDLIFS